MDEKPTYEELEQRVKELEREAVKHEQAEEALQKSEEKYRVLFEKANIAIFVAQDGMLKSPNPKALDLHGYSEEEFSSKPFIGFVHPDDQKLVQDRHERRLRGETPPNTYSYRIIKKNGDTRWVELNVIPFLWAGKPATLCFMTDITDRKQAEEELRESKEKYLRLVETNPYGIQEIDTTGIITYTNPAYQRMLGYTEEELSGESILNLLEPASRRNELREYLSALCEDQPQPKIYLQKNRIKNGRVIDQEVAWEYDRDSEGRIVGFTSVITDVTERKTAEDALRLSEERFRAIYEYAPVLINAFDESGNCVLWNEQCRRTFGWTIEEINAHEDALAVFYPDPAVCDEVRRTVTTDPDGRFREWHPVTKDGKVLSIMWANFRLPDGLAFSLGYDLTERKRMEQELLKIEKLESLGVLAGGIAHDLNNYLTGIVGNIGLAKMFADPAEKDKRLEIAEADAMRVKELTQRLLTFSKGGVPVRKLSDLGQVVRDAVNFTLSGSNLGCDYDLPDEAYPAEIDEGQIRQVINNLVINAQQAMSDGGKIKVSAEKVELAGAGDIPLAVGPYVKISVEDWGTGILEEYRNRIFDPFFTTKPTGNGLGLATAFSIIQKHSGYISVESEAGVGTKFEIYLPASAGELTDPEDEEVSDSWTGEGRILVMDDQESIRDIVELSLSNLGYEVVTCLNGAEVIEKYQDARDSGNPFQAVILDLTIPGGMGGRETIDRLKEIDPGITAIVTTGYADDPVITDYRDHGFKGVITKPFSIEGLKTVLHEVLKES